MKAVTTPSPPLVDMLAVTFPYHTYSVEARRVPEFVSVIVRRTWSLKGRGSPL